MTNTAEIVRKYLNNSPCIRRNLDIKLININALAKMIIKQQKLDATIDAVTSAIRRYKLDYPSPIFDTAFEIILKTSSISTKSGLASIYIENKNKLETNNFLSKLNSIIDQKPDHIIRIIQLNNSIKIIFDEKNINEIQELFPERTTHKINPEIAEIKINTHTDGKNTPGMLALIATELSINSVNVIDIISPENGLIFYVKEKDLVKAYNAIHNLCNTEVSEVYLPPTKSPP